MKNKLINVVFGFLATILFFSVFSLFLLNTVGNELNIGGADELIRQALMKSQQFGPDEFGHQIGKKINDPIYNGEVIEVSPSDYQPNGQNYINLGPGIVLFPGRYRLTYELFTSDSKNDEDFAVIDVFLLGRGVEATRTLKYSQNQPIYRQERIDFETTGGQNFEFRVLYLGQGKVRVGKTKIETLSRNYKLLFFKSFSVLKRLSNSK